MTRDLQRAFRGFAIVALALLDRKSVEGASLLVDQGRVVVRGEADGADLVEAHPAATIVDLDGAYLLPGLVDLRVHAGRQRSPGHVQELGPEGTSRLLSAAGVTLYLDLQLGDVGREWRRRQVDGNSKSARIQIGSPIITAPGGAGADLPTARLVTSTAQVDSILAKFAPIGGVRSSNAITVVYDSRSPHRQLAREILAYLLSDMRQRGTPIVVEVGNWNDAKEALSEGARYLCHLPEGDMPESLRPLVRALHPSWIPTVAVGSDFVDLIEDSSLRADPELQRLAPSELLEDYPKVRIPQARFAEVRERQRASVRNLSALDELGAQWLAGSDAGGVGTFFGWTLRRELQHWEAAGIDPWKILRGATVDAAHFLNRDYGFTPGSLADYVVLPGDPSQDLSTLDRPVAVISRGRWVDVEAMLSMVHGPIREELPPNPIPFGGRFGLFILVVLGFMVLLLLRGLVKRAVREGDPQ